MNTAVGQGALKNNSTGNENSALGEGTLANNTTGNYNSAFGRESLHNSNGDNNTAVGWRAGFQTGSNNTSVGFQAGYAAGNNNTAVGAFADFAANVTNATAIGYGAVVTTNNTIQLGADGTRNGYPAVTLVKTSGTINANNVTLTSDLRLKSNISPLANSLATVMQLNPVHYLKKGTLASTGYTREENGFIAQEIQKILPFIVTEGTDENKLLSVDYTSLIPMLTKAIQEQQKQIEDQNAKIAAQQKQIEELIKLVKGQ